jgi:3-deoxy-D-manno-octulosonic-acid transferase
VIFGPNYQKFKEARDLINLGGAFSVTSEKDFLQILDKFYTDELFCRTASEINRKYVADNRGATARIVEFIQLEIIGNPNRTNSSI